MFEEVVLLLLCAVGGLLLWLPSGSFDRLGRRICRLFGYEVEPYGEAAAYVGGAFLTVLVVGLIVLEVLLERP